MLEILDPRDIDPIAYDGGLLEKIRAHSLLPDRRIGWHYAMDYTWLAMHFDRLYQPGMRIVDIGCGPGAIHGYLESRYDVNILGIDMEKWDTDYVDVTGNFTDEVFRAAHNIGPDSLDMIISASAFEHNPPEEHRRLVQICMDSLKPGGVLLTTFATGRGETHFFKPTLQWNLTRQEIESVYGDRFQQFDYESVWERWRIHHDMAPGCQKRFGRVDANDPPYLSVGAAIVKRAA